VTDAVTLRPATPADARAIAAISVRGWEHAYADFLDSRVLAQRTVESQAERWRAWLAGDVTQTTVAQVAGRIAGYATVGASRDADATPAVGELAGLYVDPSAQGAGLGTQLLEDALTRLSAAGFTSATLWVFEENGLGRAFYERHGWAVDPGGAGREGADWHGPAVRYRRDL
jgi:ribosomal protein S18 acetylase RimI-like enzyme